MDSTMDYLKKGELNIVLALTLSMSGSSRQKAIEEILNYCLNLQTKSINKVCRTLKVKLTPDYVDKYFSSNIKFINDEEMGEILKWCSLKEKRKYLSLLFMAKMENKEIEEAEKIIKLMPIDLKYHFREIILQEAYVTGLWHYTPNELEKHLGRKLDNNELEKILEGAINGGSLYLAKKFAKKLNQSLSADNFDTIYLANVNSRIERIIPIIKATPVIKREWLIAACNQCLSCIEELQYLPVLMKMFSGEDRKSKIKIVNDYLFKNLKSKSSPLELNLIASALIMLAKMINKKEKESMLEEIFLECYERRKNWRFNLLENAIDAISLMNKSNKNKYFKKIFIDQLDEACGSGAWSKDNAILTIKKIITFIDETGRIFLHDLLINFLKENKVDKSRFVAEIIIGL